MVEKMLVGRRNGKGAAAWWTRYVIVSLLSLEHERILVASTGLPAFDETGNLPPGVDGASLEEILTSFCHGDVREHWGNVLQDVLALARSTRYGEAVSIFGSFVTAKATPADVDLFLVMSGDFASNLVEGRACLLFDRSRAAMVWGIVSTGSRPALIGRPFWLPGSSGVMEGPGVLWRDSGDEQ